MTSHPLFHWGDVGYRCQSDLHGRGGRVTADTHDTKCHPKIDVRGGSSTKFMQRFVLDEEIWRYNAGMDQSETFFCLSFVSKLITERIRETLQFSSCCHHVAMPRNWGAKRDTAFFIYRLPIFHNISMHFYKTFYIYTHSSHIHYICNNSILCIIYLHMIYIIYDDMIMT